ncbi:MAG: ATP-binding protein [Oscillibacter sp.]|jgi:two-component system phosphate regulon sensor histidine kinase PhoR|nr:ATP-binding protein [Oscillibacter sp.]
MTKRIFQSILTVSLTVLLAGALLLVGILHAYFEERVETELRHQAAYIAHGVENEGLGYFTGNLPDAARVTWVSSDGTVLFDNREDAASMENHADRLEIRTALKSGEGQSARYSETLAQKTIYYALRLPDGTVLRVSNTQYSVWMLVLQALQPAALIVLCACVLAAVIASRAAKQIVRPINEIDLNDPGENVAYDELTPLLARIRSQNRQISQQMRALRCRQEEFTAITENMGEGFLVVDARTHVLSHNTAALRLLDAEELSVSSDTSVYALNRSAEFRRAVEEALAGRRSEQLLEEEGRCRQIIANPVFQDGHLSGAVLVILDVTEKEQRESLRREFTANVSHELKTPLTSISGTAEILENGLVKPEDVAHFAGNIHREAGRLIQLINDIIQLSRLDEGGFSAEWTECDLYGIAREALEQLRPAAEEKQVTLSLAGQPAVVRAVPRILEEIVFNLCDNAVKYNRTGGSVSVTAEPSDAGARITVADTGIGIPEAARDRIFERFYRVDKSHPTGGTGLGLSIVKHGAAYLGAAVEVKSQPGRGSVFTLTFPAESPDGEKL